MSDSAVYQEARIGGEGESKRSRGTARVREVTPVNPRGTHEEERRGAQEERTVTCRLR
jgi:hypothetical protein